MQPILKQLGERLHHDQPGGGGVYFLFENDECVYVGSTFSFKQRFDNHLSEKRLPLEAPRFFKMPPWEDHLIRVVEAAYIKLLEPKYNVIRPQIEFFAALSWHAAAARSEQIFPWRTFNG